jgi:hypothetical protein
MILCTHYVIIGLDRKFSHIQQKKRHIEKRGLLNASHARPSTIHQCMGLSDHVTLNSNSEMSVAPVFWDIETAFYTTWLFFLLFKLFKLKFLNSLIQLISFSSFSEKIRVLVRGEMSTPRDIKQEYHKVPFCLLYCTIYMVSPLTGREGS